MVNSKFGMSNWDQPLGQGRQRQPVSDVKRDPFMKLLDGNNAVRVLTQPFQYMNHKYKVEGEPGFGDNVRCSMPLHGSCPVCALGDKPKKRWYVAVIDRKDNLRKLLDISVAVFGQIKDLNASEDWGDPIHYDINIKMDKNSPSPQQYYSVLPKSKKPLTETDLALKEEVNEEDIATKCTPPTPENVASRLNFLRKKRNLSELTFPTSVAKMETVVVDHGASDDSESDGAEDFSFPAAS